MFISNNYKRSHRLPYFILALLIVIVIVTIIIAIYTRSKRVTDPWAHRVNDVGIIHKSADVPSVKFPFKNLYDDKSNKINIILLSAPFRNKEDDDYYKDWKKRGLYFCGISSYREFPQHISNEFEDKYHEREKHCYLKLVDAWLHCFRDPARFLIDCPEYSTPDPTNKPKTHIPNMLMTEADLKNPDDYKYDPNQKKEYDFIYVCLKDSDTCPDDGWQASARNWALAKKCLVIMCRDFKLKGILIGRQNCKITEFCNNMMTMTDLLPYHEFQNKLKSAKFIFCPNIQDASPRVLVEAMLYNMPILVNSDIIGGFHNVIPNVTGEFFNSENNVTEPLRKIVTAVNNGGGTYKPREWYVNNRGRKHSGKALAEFLIKNYPNINNKTMEYAYV